MRRGTITCVALGILLGVGLWPAPGVGQALWSRDAYERLKAGEAARALRFNNEQRQVENGKALARRNHTGDRTLLMGCDLAPRQLAAEDRRLERVIASQDYEAFVDLERRANELGLVIEAEVDALPESSLEEDDEAWLAAATSRDQHHRASLSAPPPVGLEDMADEVIALRLEAMCAEDMAHTTRLGEIAPRLDRLSRAALRNAYLLLMHADHDPALQAEGAAQFSAMIEAGQPYGEAFATLSDRSALNYGRPQIYGRLYNCDNDPPAPDGPSVDIAVLDRNRESVGLESFETEFARLCRS